MEDTISCDIQDNNSVSGVALQLKQIQESQDAILTDIRTEMSQLEVENFVLKRLNSALLAEKSYWERLYRSAWGKNVVLDDTGIPNASLDLIEVASEIKSPRIHAATQKSFSAHSIGERKCRESRKKVELIENSPKIRGEHISFDTLRNIRSLKNRSTNTPALNTRLCDKEDVSKSSATPVDTSTASARDNFSTCSTDRTSVSSRTSRISGRTTAESCSSEASCSKTAFTESHASRTHKPERRSKKKCRHKHKVTDRKNISGCFKFFQKPYSRKDS